MEKSAKEGGKPVRDDYLVFGQPEITKEDINSVVSVLKSKWIGTGPITKQFEDEVKKYLGCKHAIAVNSCTSALHLALLCNEIGEGDEVITTSMTFAATVNVIEHVGATPIFVDIEKDSLNIDPAKIEEKITNKTKAIMPVHFAGLSCNMDKINEIAKKHNLVVIEDAAHAIGAEYKNKKIGTGENIACFSFYVTKNITTAEGGMIVLNDDELAKKIRIYSLHGLSKHAYQRFEKNAKKGYQVLFPGFKNNMADMNAALGLTQFKKIDEISDIRKKYAMMYLKAFSNNELIELPPDSTDSKNVWHLFPILINIDKLKISRDEFIDALNKENIGAGIHYNAIHMEPYYVNKYGTINGLDRAEYVSKRTLSLPMQTSMNENDVHDVINAVNKICQYFKK
jgi:dTDP-4-amino-4,6-dideoxygalactose transaminase